MFKSRNDEQIRVRPTVVGGDTRQSAWHMQRPQNKRSCLFWRTLPKSVIAGVRNEAGNVEIGENGEVNGGWGSWRAMKKFYQEDNKTKFVLYKKTRGWRNVENEEYEINYEAGSSSTSIVIIQ